MKSVSARRAILIGAAACCTAPAFAQDRTDDNAVTQAEDAFGFSVGRESIGIYNAFNTRGFSPTAAGNVRIDGLYFDPVFGLHGGLIDSVSIKVGLSAQGYPFAAPSGIVDQRLRRPGDKAGGSALVSGDSWGGAGAEAEGSIPLSKTFALRVSGNLGRQVFPNGTDNFNHTQTVLARWRPSRTIEIVPFWGTYNDYNDESGTFYVPAGSYIGIVDEPLHDEGPEWADIRFSGTNAGVVSSFGLGANSVFRLGAFRSSVFNKTMFNHLIVDQQPDGSGERILIADPPSHNRSLSGEARITHSILDGPRLHVFHLSARKRDSRREFGGSDVISFGIGESGEVVTAPKPEFEFGEQTRVRTEQMTYGLAYDGRWKDVGELSFSVSKADYRKTTRIPEEAAAIAESQPWLYNATAAVLLSKRASIYAGFARGFEESGTAPPSAANRNEPLSSILTKQKDAGIRFDVAENVRAVAGVFDLSRPYFGFDSANVFRQVGTTRSRGAEFSLSGRVLPSLNLLVGGVLLRPRVTRSPDAQGEIGERPFGLPTHIVSVNANWTAPFVEGLQFDLGMSHRGRQPATVDNLVYMPARFNMSAGTRYGFKLAGQDASFRLQVGNLLDNNTPSTAGPGVYGPGGSRQVNSSLVVDF